jgi:hypothetical protein
MRLGSPVALVAALVCLTNVAGLGRGAYNRAEIESELTLTSHELRFDDPGDESTVTLLQIAWVQEDRLMFGCDALTRVGFDCSMDPSHRDSHRFYSRQPERTIYVALEYDGPAWRRYRATQERLLAPLQGNASDTARMLRMLDGSTRLVAVDVHVDPRELRRRYADARRYLVSRARMSAYVQHTDDRPPRPVVAGSINKLIPSVINVPLPHSRTLRELVRRVQPYDRQRPFEAVSYRATIRYGQLHEPWLVAVAAP